MKRRTLFTALAAGFASLFAPFPRVFRLRKGLIYYGTEPRYAGKFPARTQLTIFPKDN